MQLTKTWQHCTNGVFQHHSPLHHSPPHQEQSHHKPLASSPASTPDQLCRHAISQEISNLSLLSLLLIPGSQKPRLLLQSTLRKPPPPLWSIMFVLLLVSVRPLTQSTHYPL